MKGDLINSVRSLAGSTPCFSVHDVKRLVGKEYAYLILNKLTKRREIFRIARGYYSRYDDPGLIVYALKPAYIGLHDAMSLLNLWEQETAVVIVTARRVRQGTRETFGNNVIVHRIKPEYFFGFDFLQANGYSLPVSTVEKTLIDLFYFNEWLDDYMPLFRERVDKKVLIEYLNRYRLSFRTKVMKRLGIM